MTKKRRIFCSESLGIPFHYFTCEGEKKTGANEESNGMPSALALHARFGGYLYRVGDIIGFHTLLSLPVYFLFRNSSRSLFYSRCPTSTHDHSLAALQPTQSSAIQSPVSPSLFSQFQAAGLHSALKPRRWCSFLSFRGAACCT
mmetsp:Transcript_27111/g.68028  ORF Transcript_27111/g.68028 Transcript_27111/m.68028 type:complete len:144 (+) Transcript_27111:200-631(+)